LRGEGDAAVQSQLENFSDLKKHGGTNLVLNPWRVGGPVAGIQQKFASRNVQKRSLGRVSKIGSPPARLKEPKTQKTKKGKKKRGLSLDPPMI